MTVLETNGLGCLTKTGGCVMPQLRELKSACIAVLRSSCATVPFGAAVVRMLSLHRRAFAGFEEQGVRIQSGGVAAVELGQRCSQWEAFAALCADGPGGRQLRGGVAHNCPLV